SMRLHPRVELQVRSLVNDPSPGVGALVVVRGEREERLDPEPGMLEVRAVLDIRPRQAADDTEVGGIRSAEKISGERRVRGDLAEEWRIGVRLLADGVQNAES